MDGVPARLDSAPSLGQGSAPSLGHRPGEQVARARTVHGGQERAASPDGGTSRRAASDGAGGTTVPVRVVARVRPLLPFETVQSTRSCVTVHGGQTLVMGKDRAFAFDAVYGPSSPQAGIYNEWVSPLVDGLFNGYNATVLAYGQTGTGKTFTMGSGDNAGKLAEELGVIPRVMEDVYQRLEELNLEQTAGGSSREVRIRVSYIEIYNEEIKDLLDPGTSKTLAIREKVRSCVCVCVCMCVRRMYLLVRVCACASYVFQTVDLRERYAYVCRCLLGITGLLYWALMAGRRVNRGLRCQAGGGIVARRDAEHAGCRQSVAHRCRHPHE